MDAHELLNTAKVPTTKKNYVGIEIEFLLHMNKESELEKLLIAKNLQYSVHLGTDGSVDGYDSEAEDKLDAEIKKAWKKIRKPVGRNPWGEMDYEPEYYDFEYEYKEKHKDKIFDADDYYGKEIRLLATEDEAPALIDKVCSVLKEVGAKVNTTCGLHVHLDMRNRDVEIAYHNLCKSQDLMFAMQPASRRKSTYCKKSPLTRDSDRYRAVNYQAYREHGTLEIRVHEGTIKATEIKMWVGLLVYLASKKTKMVSTIKEAKQLAIPRKVKDYVNARIKKYA